VDRSIASYNGPAAQLLEVNLDKDTVELAGEAFDLVSAIEVVEHLENPGRLFDIAARHLSPNGRFLLTTPNVLSVGARLRLLLSGRVPFFDDKSDPTHLFPVLPRTVAILAERRGLEVVDRWHFPEGGTAALRPAVRAGARILSWLPEPDGGDISCWLMARRKE
jgi:SAM-dependent methyltransferase